MNAVNRRIFNAPPVNMREALRYAGARDGDSDIRELFDSAVAEALPVLRYDVCSVELPVRIYGDLCDLSAFSITSKTFSKYLHGCDSVIMFAATIGIGIDRLVNKYSNISPARAVVLNGLGAERIESLCNVLCDELKHSYLTLPRFSPGFGDLTLDVQRDILRLLNCNKLLGISLNSSMLMTPSKSVTAFVGIKSDIAKGTNI